MKRIMIVVSMIILLLISLIIRNNRVYDFRMKVTGLVMLYNENHYYGRQIRKLDDILPSYNSMLFSIKPLKYEYWLSKKDIDKLTKKNQGILI